MSDKIIIIKETWADSVIADIGTLATFAAMISIGVWLQSAAMQWTGAVIFFIGVISMGIVRNNRSRMTIKEARAELDRLGAAE